MDYRSPIASMQRELETLEEELAALRALEPPEPKPRKPPSKKARAKRANEVRSLQSTLARLENRVAKRVKELGIRSLTPTELKKARSSERVALGALVAGALIACVHLAIAARTTSHWTETTCSIRRNDDDVPVASYVVVGRKHSFVPREEDLPAQTRCWVPGPDPIDHVGHVTRPTQSAVPFADKLSPYWLMGAGMLAATGMVLFFASRANRRRRERSEIAPDDFSSDD